MSENSLYTTDQEEEDDERKIDLGPQFTIKEQLEKDKDDESLRKWKEQLLGKALEPEVKILSLSILSPDRTRHIPSDSRGWKTEITMVNNNIVLGLKYTNTVWKTGMKVDRTKKCLEPLVLKRSHTRMRCQRRLPLLATLLVDHTLQEQSFLTMITMLLGDQLHIRHS
ncbi:Rho GDP-dissociation inhibitor 1 [Bienertia sinuspersici]